jgi:hypothetical protein
VDRKATTKSFNFASKRNLDFYYVSAADGTNVVKVFEEAIRKGLECKEKPPDDFFVSWSYERWPMRGGCAERRSDRSVWLPAQDEVMEFLHEGEDVPLGGKRPVAAEAESGGDTATRDDAPPTDNAATEPVEAVTFAVTIPEGVEPGQQLQVHVYACDLKSWMALLKLSVSLYLWTCAKRRPHEACPWCVCGLVAGEHSRWTRTAGHGAAWRWSWAAVANHCATHRMSSANSHAPVSIQRSEARQRQLSGCTS